MNPDHYQLAKEECEQLVSQGIIEPTTSLCACKAFYVNKRSEQVHGKLRLVINYQPLNYFLADDKFPLPQKKSLFEHLVDAKFLSKFDLKYGFWQLVYIDDILLFSLDEQSHGALSSESQRRAGISPQPRQQPTKHEFPDELSSQKMIQQFLGLVNYMADILPKLTHHTALLFPMLKKNPPQWTSRQTEVVKAIKCLAEKMPPLKIPAFAEKRILRTDASDECWGVVLLVQDNNNKTLKRGIEKFQFHLIGHEFQVELDMSSFPRMLQFKRKILPHAQLLRWSNWFS
ncbi:putative reverse transcriptase domain, viral movement protein [Tanacetum coccineum]